jgi:hypothetical protein
MKKLLTPSLWLSCLAPGVIALALAGCGGPSSTPTGGDAPPLDETPEYIEGEKANMEASENE